MRFLVLSGILMLAAFQARATEPVNEAVAVESPQLARQESSAATQFFSCQQDSDCVLEQSACGAAAVNAGQRSAYNAYISINKPQQNCPQNRRRGLPHAVCTQQQCTVLYSDKVTLPPSDKR